MSNDIPNNAHVGDLMSGYIDGELTQQDRQRIEAHCSTCSQCSATLAELVELREAVSNSRLSKLGGDKWREDMDDTIVKVSRGIGWLIVIASALIVGGIWLFVFVTNSSIGLGTKILIALLYGGPLALFISVLRQRLIERKSDKYKDVEI